MKRAWLLGLVLLSLPASSSPSSNGEVLALLPADIWGYIGIEDFRQGYEAAKQFVDRVAPNSKLFGDLEQQVLAGIKQMPPQLRQSTQTGLKKLISAHLALKNTKEGDLPALIFLVRLEDEKVLEKLVTEDLKIFSKETLEVGAHKVFVMDPIQVFGSATYVTTLKHIGLLVTNLDVLKDILARADGGAALPGLKGTPVFDRLSTAAQAPIALKLYAQLGPFMEIALRGYNGGRYSRYQQDIQDAWLGFTGLKAAWVEVGLDKGRATSKAELEIGKSCRLYHDIWKQKTGPKELLKYVPPEAAVAAHVNVESGEAFLKQFETMLKRADELNRIESRRGEVWDSVHRGFQSEIGLTLEEAAKVIGNEAAFFLAPSDWDSMPRDTNGLCFIGMMQDETKLKEAVKKMAASRSFEKAEWKERPYKGISIMVGKNHEVEFAYAIDGKVLVMGAGEKTIQKAIDAKLGDNIAKRVTGQGSKVVSINFKDCWRMIQAMSRGGLPDWSKMMADDIFDIAVIEETDRGCSYVAQDSLGVTAFAVAALFAMTARSPVVPDVSTPPRPVREDVPKVELPNNPKEAEKLINDLIEQLSGDDAAKRNEATTKLKGIGQSIIQPLAKAAADSTDAELKSRAEDVLLYLKAYDAIPGLLEKKVKALTEQIKKAYENERRTWTWQPNEDGISNIDPSARRWDNIAAPIQDLDFGVLDSPAALRKFAQCLGDREFSLVAREGMGAVLMSRNTSACAEEFKKVFQTTEPLIKCFALICLGSATDDASRDLVMKNLESDQLGLRRSAFLAAERSTDSRLVPALLRLLESKDLETRFNAGYTLEKLTGGALTFNVFLVKEEFDAATKSANSWWETNKSTFKIVK